ncbi:MAG TPA: ABC transporter permease [Bryobacteraceae bacterium]|nr:ABC transporter permease [Bryobacteraceae bacterium]
MTGAPVARVEEIGRSSLGGVEYLGALAVQFWRSLRGIKTINPFALHPLRWKRTIDEMVAAGVGAVPIVALTGFCTGLILAFQGGSELRKLGALELVIPLVAIGITREAGPLITAITVSGRSSSAFSAEIGAMVMTEEISVLKTMALDPVQLLVSPKFLALLVVMPCLTVVADVAGILAGGFFVYHAVGTSLLLYIRAALDSLYLRDIVGGLIKSIVFATLITQIGCLQGFRVKGTPLDVGRATTSAVVRAFFLVIVADLLFTALFYVVWP